MAQADDACARGAACAPWGLSPVSRCGGVTLSVFGAAHGVVDAISAAAVVGLLATLPASPQVIVGWILLYHVLAFALQPVFGLAVDTMGRPRALAVCGCLVAACALLVPSAPLLVTMLAGAGNAAFHVGGGVICLRLTPDRATAPGLFVAPGSLGLLLGVILGATLATAAIVLLPIAAAVSLVMVCVPIPGASPAQRSSPAVGRSDLILGLVLVAIAMRAVLSFIVESPWEAHPMLLVLLTLATFFGKALGGIVADRWGWLRVGVGATLAGLPFLAWSTAYPPAAIPGLLLLNVAMPVTLAAVIKAVPEFPGFAFGLASFALLVGAIPALLGVRATDPLFVCAVVCLSAVMLYRALSWLPICKPFRQVVQV